MVSDTIVGVVVGAIIGFASSYSMWKVQIKHNRKNVAKGFYLEISSLEKKIELFARAFDTPGPGAGPVEIKQPFYSDGLFFAFRKEIFGFNQDLSEGLFEFYNCLLTADKDRKVAPSDQFFKPANEAMKSSIKKAYNLLPNLKELLKKEFS
jgi:hypothetical protein